MWPFDTLVLWSHASSKVNSGVPLSRLLPSWEYFFKVCGVTHKLGCKKRWCFWSICPCVCFISYHLVVCCTRNKWRWVKSSLLRCAFFGSADAFVFEASGKMVADRGTLAMYRLDVARIGHSSGVTFQSRCGSNGACITSEVSEFEWKFRDQRSDLWSKVYQVYSIIPGLGLLTVAIEQLEARIVR